MIVTICMLIFFLIHPIHYSDFGWLLCDVGNYAVLCLVRSCSRICQSKIKASKIYAYSTLPSHKSRFNYFWLWYWLVLKFVYGLLDRTLTVLQLKLFMFFSIPSFPCTFYLLLSLSLCKYIRYYLTHFSNIWFKMMKKRWCWA